jgi:DNA-binding XRE family transcriptional regulator
MPSKTAKKKAVKKRPSTLKQRRVRLKPNLGVVGRQLSPALDCYAGAIGERIRAARIEKGYRADDLAYVAGVSRQAWYHFEKGRHMSIQKLPLIAAALGCTVRDLIPPGEYKPKGK